jgi:hypothetical protein
MAPAVLVNGNHLYAQRNDLVNIVLGNSSPLDLPVPLLGKAVLPPADLLLEIVWLEAAGTFREAVEKARPPPTFALHERARVLASRTP